MSKRKRKKLMKWTMKQETKLCSIKTRYIKKEIAFLNRTEKESKIYHCKNCNNFHTASKKEIEHRPSIGPKVSQKEKNKKICKKIIYKDKSAAEKASKYLIKTKNIFMRSYKCPNCLMWHHTKNTLIHLFKKTKN